MTSTYWRGRNVLITGACGFIGSHITDLLVTKGANVTAVCSSLQPDKLLNLAQSRDQIALAKADLTSFEDCMRVCRSQEIVLNAAHVDGSIGYKQAHPAYILRQNMLISLNMLEAACRNQVERFLVISSTEVYAPETDVPLMEDTGFDWLPSKVTDGYAWSKRMSEFAAEVYAREHGIKVAVARPSNVYGPRDHFDSRKGRVIPMFIEKTFRGDAPILIWGTGEQIRTFLYVEDLAAGLLDLIELHPNCDPVNFSGTQEITIKRLAELIVQLSGRQVQIICDPEKPSGAPNRAADTTKASNLLGFSGRTPLVEGLQQTIAMYRERFLHPDVDYSLAADR